VNLVGGIFAYKYKRLSIIPVLDVLTIESPPLSQPLEIRYQVDFFALRYLPKYNQL